MNRTLKIASVSLGLFLLGISLYALRATGHSGETTTTPVDPKAQAEALRAVNIMRVINTAEVVNCRMKNGEVDRTEKFRPWNELLSAPCFTDALSRFTGARFSGVSGISFSPAPEIVPGLELRLVVSPDGTHYNAWLGQMKYNCGTTFYSDERGIIFEGKALGCGSSPTLGKP